MPKIFILHQKTMYVFPFEKDTFLSLNKDFFSNKKGFSIFLMEHDDDVTLKNLMAFLSDFFDITFNDNEGFKIKTWKEVMGDKKDVDYVLSKFTEFTI